MPQPPPKFEQQYFQNETPNSINVVQHNTHSSLKKEINANQPNHSKHVAHKNSPNILTNTTYSFQNPPNHVSWKIYPKLEHLIMF